jgi:DNA-binding MltR family transcriptional regulator
MNEFRKRIEHIHSFKENQEALHSLFFDHDDRTTAIMTVGFLEDVLALGIMSKFERDASENQLTELFTNYGPLANLSARIALGYLFGILGNDDKHDLNIIRKIRNDFAHVIEPINFETKEIASRCLSLKRKADLAPKFQTKAGNGPRGAFIRSALQIFGHVIFNAQTVLEERKLLVPHKREARKAAADLMRASSRGKLPRPSS